MWPQPTPTQPTRSPCSVSSTPTAEIANQPVSAARSARLQPRPDVPRGLLEPVAWKAGTAGSKGGPGARNAPGLPDYWAVDVLQTAGAQVHLAHPLGVK